ncbi:MAG TPA: C25 family cysteine peptidase, partial [Ignavibacteria bacterium]|nr:C25 family cysteine peptidase [Ignavibacteria bacterium]
MNLTKFLLILLINISTFDFLFSQDYNWITPNKTYLKLFIADDGIHRISKADFENAGVSTSAIDPRTLKVFNRGNQIPVYVRGESDGFFNDSDYVDFYGTRNYGGISNVYNQDNQIVYFTNERFDLYSDTNVYWIDWGGANGIRMLNSSYSAPSNYLQDYSSEPLHLEKDKIYWIGQATSGNDFGNFTNERYLGESWYWSLLYNGQSVSDTFSIPLLNKNQPTVSLRVFAYPQSASFTVTNEHNLQIKVNGNVVADFVRNDFGRVDTAVTFSSALLSETSVNNVTATYTSTGGFSGTMFLDLFEFKYPKVLKFRNNISVLNLAGEDSTSKKIKITGFNPGNQTFIYDVKNNIRITSFSNSADTLIFSAKQNSKIEISNKIISKKPFRIIQRQVPDLVSSVNGADYLIIYNKLFESQVLQLQNHRETYDNFRVKKAEIKDIYDIFNFGIESPDAIRNFNRHVYYNWQQPRVKYVCLFGRGSLDPKKNSDATVYRENLIPVKGNPSTDNFYSNVFLNNFIFYNQISLGRLPALTVSEAQNMVNNIITYETQPPQKWWKDFTFIGGGVNQAEQQLFLALNNDSLINPYILTNPVKGNPVRILRNDLNGAETFNYSDSIKNQINRGTLTVNFMGHAGSQDWEIALHDPEILSNHGKFPVILSMTCYTGKVGEPNFRSFGERFMKMNNTGAVTFFATSGWGFVYSGSLINSLFYKSFAKDTVRRVGDMISYAMNSIKNDSLSFSIRHTVNCYTLMGDPALKFQLPSYPELSITENDYTLSNKNPSINEPINLKIFPQNVGLNSDSASVRLVVSKNFAKYYFKDTVIRNFSSKDSISYNFKLNSKGRYEAKVILDLYNSSPNENKNDNTLIFEIDVKNFSFVPYKPVHNSVVNKDSIEYAGMNPFIDKNGKGITLILQTDTTQNFNSPVRQIFVNNAPQGVITKFKTLLPVKDTSKLYYWRTNSIIDGDSSGWSAVQMFKYNPLISFSDKTEDSPSDTLTTIYKINPQQFQPYELSNTSYNTENNSNGVKITEFPGTLYVRSLGTNGAEASYFSVMNKSIHMDAGGNSGLNLLKVRKVDGKILQHKNFK